MKKTFIIVLLVLMGYGVHSQNALSTKSKKAIEYYTEADNFRVRGQYDQAIELLNKAIEKDKNFYEAYYRLGLVYFSRKEVKTAIDYFEKGLSLTTDPNKQKVFWYDLGESYLNQGEYEKAVAMLTNYLKVETRNRRNIDYAKVLLRNAQYALEHSKDNNNFQQRPLPALVNTFYMQYFPALTADQKELIFTKRDGQTDEFDEDLVVSVKDKNGNWQKPLSISDSINSTQNEGTCTVSADGRKLIFTSCGGRPGYGSCDLYESHKTGDKWTSPKNLGPAVNTSEWESQPSLSADGRTLYFVSDRKGGYGRRDIWMSQLDETNQWKKAVNMGKQINSQYDEISPFIHANNKTLYYASNGLPGFGGYDIFFSERQGATWTKPQNAGSSMNNHNDQFSLFITADGTKGYFSYEEHVEGGQARGKIYEIDIPEDQRPKYKSNYVTGIIRDKETGTPLAAQVELINLENEEVESMVSSDSITGEYLIVLTQGAEYALYVNKSKYLFQSQNFNYSEVHDFKPIVLNVDLDKIKTGSAMILRNIFFDVDKFALEEKSKTELQKVIRIMNDNPKLKVEISGHTDNVGAADYNQQLSEKRAGAVYDYLVANGILATRLIKKGYGSKNPMATNETEEGRQQNRRIEFKVMKLD